MDLGAYAQIENLALIAKKNGISVPRLRGYRLMKDEEPMSAENLMKDIDELGIHACEDILRSVCPGCYEYSMRTTRRINKYMVKGKKTALDGHEYESVVGVNWGAVHGKLRKKMKFAMKKVAKRSRKQWDMFNKYAGRNDVLYIHSRIGGPNWRFFGGPLLEEQSWFLEKVDDAFDETYRDIYAKIEPITK